MDHASEPQTHTLTLDRTDQAPRLARQFVRDLMSGRLGPEKLYDLTLLVSEMVGNAVVFARLGPVELTLAEGGPEMRVAVACPQEPWTARPELGHVGLDDSAGWGYHLVEVLSIHWGESNDERVLWAVFELGRVLERSPRA